MCRKNQPPDGCLAVGRPPGPQAGGVGEFKIRLSRQCQRAPAVRSGRHGGPPALRDARGKPVPPEDPNEQSICTTEGESNPCPIDVVERTCGQKGVLKATLLSSGQS